MKDNIIIFGAGQWGRIAYYYYYSTCIVKCFVDNSEVLCGTYINGVKIYKPDILKTLDLDQIKIVIANKRRTKQIQEQLYNDYGICRSIVFEISENVNEYVPYYYETDCTDECIIEYEGGLGNQMFQYALAECLLKKGIRVTGDVSSYYNVGRRKFVLEDIFPSISIQRCNIGLKQNYKKNGFYIIEESILSLDKKKTDVNILKKEKGYFEGYWQSVYYVQLVENNLRKSFQFINKKDKKLCEISNEIMSKNAVSIHIRRGDYLEPKAKKIFGGICTDEYYKKAITYIQENVENPTYYFFSNDIKWVKKIYKDFSAVYIESDLFDDYEDWYDMYLMSVCKHNIIANSTFSWWGAWLNQNENKIVVVPSKWINGCEYEDIYPSSWIKLFIE